MASASSFNVSRTLGAPLIRLLISSLILLSRLRTSALMTASTLLISPFNAVCKLPSAATRALASALWLADSAFNTA